MDKQEVLIERLARKQGITVETMRERIVLRIREGFNNPDPIKREQWKKIPCIGDMPTPDEYLDYVLKRVYEEGKEELLRRYL